MGINVKWSPRTIGTAQNIYRSTEPFGPDSLPAVLAELPATDMDYEDSTAVEGVLYYYAIEVVLGARSILSQVVSAVGGAGPDIPDVSVVDFSPVAWVRAGFTSNKTFTAGQNPISFTATDYDVGNWWTSGTDLVVPAGVTMAVVTAHMFGITKAQRETYILVKKNGVGTKNQRQFTWSEMLPLQLSQTVRVVAGDVLTVEVYVSSATTANYLYSKVSVVGYS